MAILSQRLHRLGDNGYDVIHFETESVLVLRSNGTTVESAIQALEKRVAEGAVQFPNNTPGAMTPGSIIVVGDNVYIGKENGVPLQLTGQTLTVEEL